MTLLEYGKKIGDTLKTLRQEKGISVQDVAQATGLSVSTICMYESGKRIPQDMNKITLAGFYDKTVGEIFFNDDVTK